LIENVDDIIITLSRGGEILYQSPAIERALGYHPYNPSDHGALHYLHPDDLPLVSKVFSELVEQAPGAIHRLEFRLRHKNGSWRNFECTARLTHDQQGEVCALINLHDITERVAAEAEIQSQRDLLDGIFQNADVAIFLLDVEADGQFRYVTINKKDEEITGVCADQVTGKTVPELVPFYLTPEDAATMQANYQRVVETGQQLVYEELLPVAGKEIWWLTRLTPLFDAEGRIYRLLGTSLEINERKQMEEELRLARDELEQRVMERTQELHESESQLRRAVLNTPFPSMIHAEDGQVLLLSQTWMELSGYTPEDIPSIDQWVKKAYGGERDFMLEKSREYFQLMEKQYHQEVEITTKDGQRRIWDFHDAPLGTDSDRRRLVISMADDVTERVQAERQLAKFAQDLERSNEELKQFA
jgi:PAS domain S-box-containing protein